jgi:hypothetical protein
MTDVNEVRLGPKRDNASLNLFEQILRSSIFRNFELLYLLVLRLTIVITSANIPGVRLRVIMSM